MAVVEVLSHFLLHCLVELLVDVHSLLRHLFLSFEVARVLFVYQVQNSSEESLNRYHVSDVLKDVSNSAAINLEQNRFAQERQKEAK